MTAEQNIWFCRLFEGKKKRKKKRGWMPLQAPTCAPSPITGTFVTGVTQAVRLPVLKHQYSVAVRKIHTSTRRQEKIPRTSSCSTQVREYASEFQVCKSIHSKTVGLHPAFQFCISSPCLQLHACLEEVEPCSSAC